jgi:hypothetical protein
LLAMIRFYDFYGLLIASIFITDTSAIASRFTITPKKIIANFAVADIDQFLTDASRTLT